MNLLTNLLTFVVAPLILLTTVYLFLAKSTNPFKGKGEETKQEDRRKSGSEEGREKDIDEEPRLEEVSSASNNSTKGSAKSASPVEKKIRKHTSSSKRKSTGKKS